LSFEKVHDVAQRGRSNSKNRHNISHKCSKHPLTYLSTGPSLRLQLVYLRISVQVNVCAEFVCTINSTSDRHRFSSCLTIQVLSKVPSPSW
jgi:hypothetical protein